MCLFAPNDLPARWTDMVLLYKVVSQYQKELDRYCITYWLFIYIDLYVTSGYFLKGVVFQ